MEATKSALLAIALLCAVQCALTHELELASIRRSLLTIPSLDNVRASCKTVAKVTLSITSGASRVKAVSACTAFASSISGIEEVWGDYVKNIQLGKNDTCTVVRIEDVVSLCAQSVAKTYTSAQLEIDIKGKAKACARAEAEGDAFAKSFAFVFVNMWLGVTDGFTSAEADAQVSALTFALAKVWAGAKKQACLKNTGNIEESEESYAAQIRLGLACVFAEVAVKLCKQYYKGDATEDACGACEGGELEKFFVATESSAEAQSCSKTTTILDESSGNAKTDSKPTPVPCSETTAKTCCEEQYNDVNVCLLGKNRQFKRVEGDLWENQKDGSKPDCFCEEIEKPAKLD